MLYRYLTKCLNHLDTSICFFLLSFRILNLCGSSVSLESVKKVLLRCRNIESINLSSCRALPRGMKRLYTGKELQDLKDSLDPEKAKTKENLDQGNKKKGSKKIEADSKTEASAGESPKQEDSGSPNYKSQTKPQDKSSESTLFQEPKSVTDSGNNKQTSMDLGTKSSPDSKTDPSSSKDIFENTATTSETKRPTGGSTPKLLSPIAQLKPDSSSTPRSELTKTDMASPHFSPVSKPDSQVQNSPEVMAESIKSNSWNLGQFKTTPTHKSEASPLNRLESHSKLKHGKMTEQCSPTTSLDNKPSPETLGVKQDIKTPSSWSYGSPMPRQDTQFSSQRSPYSAQPSPAQPSPYSTQPSPYSTQPSPYSSQPSPYSAQPSPDTSQIIKPDLQKSGAWNTGNYSPMTKHHAPFSPHPSTHTSPDPGLGVKSDIRSNPNKTPGQGQFSPMSRQDRHHHSPYSPRPSVDNVAYSNKKSPGVAGGYSPMMRQDCHLPSPDGGQTNRPVVTGRPQDIYGRSVSKVPEIIHNNVPTPDIPNSWGIDRFNQLSNTPTSSIESLVWGGSAFGAEPPMAPRVDNIPTMLNTPPVQAWNALPPFDSAVRRPTDTDISDPWTLGHFRVEPPHQVQNTFVEQNVTFDSLSGHVGHQSHVLPSFLDDGYTETSRVD